MVVAVESGLGEVSKELRARGYTIVSYPEYGGVVDAFIYKEELSSNIGGYQNSEPVGSLGNDTPPSGQGVLVVNVNNKSLEQIEEILQKRIYSRLF